MSLMVEEQEFLDQLVVHGNEIEVQLAMEKLQDEDLFFDYETPKHLKYNQHNNKSEDEREATPSPRPKLDRESRQGSRRRLDILEQRKNSTIQEKMWKAHEHGLAVTQTASRKSLMLRRESSSGSGSNDRDIFRRSDSSAKKLQQQQVVAPPASQ
jgi:hypothetical protein